MQVYTQVNIGNMSDFEAAQKIAFALAKAAHEQEQALPVIEAERLKAEPSFDPHAWTPPVDEPDMKDPGQLPEAHDLAYTRWIEGLPLTDEQRRDAAVVRETREADIGTYRGSAAEQGDTIQRQFVERDPRAAQRDRMLVRRRKDLL